MRRYLKLAGIAPVAQLLLIYRVLVARQQESRSVAGQGRAGYMGGQQLASRAGGHHAKAR